MSASDPLAALKKGSAFPTTALSLSETDVAAYLDATGDEAFAALGAGGIVPPLAAAALLLRSMLATFDLPQGSVHTGEEIEFVRPARTGEELRCETAVLQSSDRQGYRFATVEQRAVDAAGEPVLITRATVMSPLGRDGDGS